MSACLLWTRTKNTGTGTAESLPQHSDAPQFGESSRNVSSDQPLRHDLYNGVFRAALKKADRTQRSGDVLSQMMFHVPGRAEYYDALLRKVE